MSTKIDDGGPAFAAVATSPMGDVHHQEGMSLRDWFAGQALANFVRDYETNGRMIDVDTVDEVAADAYAMADAMLAARSA